MKNIFKYIGISIILVFSIYYSEIASNIIIKNNNLFKNINDNKYLYETKPINAYVDGDYIIPGLCGKSVNVFDSYYNMSEINVFNEDYLIYYNVTPDVSINNNKDKIIYIGNSNKNSVSLLIENNKNIINYLVHNNIKFDRLIKLNEYSVNNKYEMINNDYDNYKYLERRLEENHNNNICYVNNNINNLCNNKFIIKETIHVSNSNIYKYINEINSGYIIFIDDNLSIENILLILNNIRFKNLDIVYISKLISE